MPLLGCKRKWKIKEKSRKQGVQTPSRGEQWPLLGCKRKRKRKRKRKKSHANRKFKLPRQGNNGLFWVVRGRGSKAARFASLCR